MGCCCSHTTPDGAHTPHVQHRRQQELRRAEQQRQHRVGNAEDNARPASVPSSGAAKAAESLAALDWVMATDPKTGREYYFNKHTKQSSWKKPPGYDRVAAEREAAYKGGHWVKAVDKKGRTYYYDKISRQTRWDKPPSYREGKRSTPKRQSAVAHQTKGSQAPNSALAAQPTALNSVSAVPSAVTPAAAIAAAPAVAAAAAPAVPSAAASAAAPAAAPTEAPTEAPTAGLAVPSERGVGRGNTSAIVRSAEGSLPGSASPADTRDVSAPAATPQNTPLAAMARSTERQVREAEFFRSQKAAREEDARRKEKLEEERLSAMDEEEREKYLADKKASADHEKKKARMLKQQVAKGGYGNKAAKKALAGRRGGRGGRHRSSQKKS